MEIRFTLHSRLRMKQRGMKEAEVIQVLTKSNSVESGKEGNMIATKNLNDKELCIVYLTKIEYNLVITVYKRRKKRR
jgi:hypothetical protein